MTRTYELGFIVEPRVSEDEAQALCDKYKGMIEDSGAQVTTVDHWGKRKLAYPIQKYTEGRYYFLYVSADGTVPWPDVERLLMQDEKVLRYLVVRTDEDIKRALRKGKVPPPVPNASEVGEDETGGESSAATGDAETGDAATGDAAAGDDETGDAKTGDAETGDAATGDAETGDAETGDDAATGDAETGDDAATGDAATGDAATGDAETGDAETGDGENSDAETTGGTESDDDSKGE